MPTGTILAKNALVFRIAVGDATTDETGNKYELSAAFHSHAPLIRSHQTGKMFALSWDDIIRLAIDAGIDKEGEEHEHDSRN